MDPRLSDTFSKGMKLLIRPDGFMLYATWPMDFSSTSELLYAKTTVRLRLLRARPNSYMSVNITNVGIRTVDCSLCSRRVLPKDDYDKDTKDLLAFIP